MWCFWIDGYEIVLFFPNFAVVTRAEGSGSRGGLNCLLECLVIQNQPRQGSLLWG